VRGHALDRSVKITVREFPDEQEFKERAWTARIIRRCRPQASPFCRRWLKCGGNLLAPPVAGLKRHNIGKNGVTRSLQPRCEPQRKFIIARRGFTDKKLLCDRQAFRRREGSIFRGSQN